MSRWSDLLSELFQIIAEKATNYVDYIYIRAVCKSWQSALPKKPHNLLCELSWLLLPHRKDSPNHRGFYNLADGKTYRLDLPEAYENGVVNWHDPNSLTASKRRLKDRFIRKAILSATPSSAYNFMVGIICGQKESLAFCTSGDIPWTVVAEISPPVSYKDIMFRAGNFYVVDKMGRVSICETENPPTLIRLADPPPAPTKMGTQAMVLGKLKRTSIIGEGHDFGIFDFQDGNVRRLGLPSYQIKQPQHNRSFFILPPSVWVTINARTGSSLENF
ncbi:unnamed protein product [Dovyalis caffra]|uniref:KIB1-4 beta-propeller domain-containing protein n=1 Tax=Dovyalis caffra TaxID=77055 RepID=A0AAV1S7B4_9ROSI|nr:unnamed protein product [Dovyalis caffra]